MSDIEARRIYQIEENDERFWENLREISEHLGWELHQTLKACFAIGWDRLSQTVKPHRKESIDDKEELDKRQTNPEPVIESR